MLLRNQIHKRIEKRSKRQLFNWLCLSVSLNVALGIILLNRGSNKLNLGPADEFRKSIPERWVLREAELEAEHSAAVWFAYTDYEELEKLIQDPSFAENAKRDSAFYGDALAKLVRNSTYAEEFNVGNMTFDRNRLQLAASNLELSPIFRQLFGGYVEALEQLELKKRFDITYGYNSK